jgi:hypothetical protein
MGGKSMNTKKTSKRPAFDLMSASDLRNWIDQNNVIGGEEYWSETLSWDSAEEEAEARDELLAMAQELFDALNGEEAL